MERNSFCMERGTDMPEEVRERIERLAENHVPLKLTSQEEEPLQVRHCRKSFTEGAHAGWAEGRAEIEWLRDDNEGLSRTILNRGQEIKRLREALELIASMDGRNGGCTYCAKNARKALAGKGDENEAK